MTDTLPKADDLDLRLIELCQDNPEYSVKNLAALLEAGERTILNRLKKLSANNIFQITYQWDIQAVGFNVNGYVIVRPDVSSLDLTIDALSDIEEIIIISQQAVAATLFCFVVSKDFKHFGSVLGRIRSVQPNVTIENVEIVSEVLKYPYVVGGISAGSDTWPTQQNFSIIYFNLL